MNVDASAEWSDGWWAVTITLPDGSTQHTQARTLGKVEHMVKDLVSLLLEIEADGVHVDTRPVLPTGIEAALAAIGDAHNEAELAKAREVAARRNAAAAMRSRNLTLRDVGALMGVSHQRAAQLLQDV